MQSKSAKLFFSVVVPVYNRPAEVQELLESLTKQSYSNFEVIIVEDGSSIPCKDIVSSFSELLEIRYIFKENTGQGFSRNVGFKLAKGDYFVAFDSDCIIPDTYLEIVNNSLNANWLDAYGGPDEAHASFTPLQKAISYSMTSIFTTGGIRGKNKNMDVFLPRGFNMGLSKQVFKNTGGFIDANKGEDIELSIRISKNGFRVGLISEAFVYHKRRTSLVQFFRQARSFGRNRVYVSRFHPEHIKMVHWFPAVFLFGFIFYLFLPVWNITLFYIASVFLGLYLLCIVVDSAIKNKSLIVGFLSSITAVVQLTAYGIGFLIEFLTPNKSGIEKKS